jgi:TolA-binding protein
MSFYCNVPMTLCRRSILFVLWVALVSPALGQNTKENADFKLAINLYNDGLYDLAAEQLRQFIAAYPSTDQGIEARFYLGMAQQKLGRFGEARLTFQTFALTYQNNPRAPEAWWHVGESFAAEGNYREAALAYERVKVFHAKSKQAPQALVEAGRSFALAGAPEDARRVLRMVLQEYGATPAALSARTLLGQIYFEEGNFELAQTELRRVINGDPSADARAQALLVLGNVYQAMGRSDQAIATYREIIKSYQKTSALQGAYLNLGRLQLSLGMYDEAVTHLTKALAETSTLDSALVRDGTVDLADAYTAKKDFRAALSIYEHYLKQHPGDRRTSEVEWKYARAAHQAGQYERSSQLCRRLARAEVPDRIQQQALLLLAQNAEDQQNFSQAAELYGALADRAAQTPSAPRMLMRQGEILGEELADHRRASAAFELVASRYPASPLVDDALFAAAESQEALREFDQALQLYRQLATRYPSSDLIARTDERITLIETFEAKNKDSGLEKLALLVGDVVAEKDRAGLSFRLGEIYFNDLKNYRAAAEQFSAAAESPERDARTVEAMYYRAKSYEYLSWKDESYRRRAIEAFEGFLQAARGVASEAVTARKEEAALALFTMTASSLPEARAAYQATTTLVPNSRRQHEMLLRVGLLQEEADSITAALATYSEIIQRSPSSPSAAEARYRRAELLHTLGLDEPALDEGRRYLKDYPKGRHASSVLMLLGGIASSRGEYAEAITDYRQLGTEFFYTAAADSAPILQAEAQRAAGHPEEAIDLYESLVEEQRADLLEGGEADPVLRLALANAQIEAGREDEARPDLFRLAALRSDPAVAAEAMTMLGMIYRREGSVETATSYFRQASALAPGATARPEVADLLFEGGQYAEAVGQYARLSKGATTDSLRQYYDAQIIICRLRSDDLTQANKDIAAFKTKYSSVSAELASFELERGSYAFRRKDYGGALKSFRTVADRYDDTPSAAPAMYWIGRTLEVQGDLPGAVKELKELVAEHPKAPIIARARLALGNISFTAERWDEAINNYRAVVEDSSTDPEILPMAMSNLINTYDATGSYDAALELSRRYLAQYPNNEDSFDKRIKIGILYERLGYHEQSILQLEGLLDEAGSDLEAELRYYIGEAYYNKGDYQQAILEFLKVPYLVTKIGKIDWTANSLYMSGQAYERMGRHEQAVTMYQQILDRPGIDGTYKAAARKEIDRVNTVLQKKPG